MFLPYQIEDLEHEFRFRPVICSVFCVAYMVFSAAAFKMLPPDTFEDLAYTFGAVPMDFKWWSPLTCTFLHGDLLHLLGNLYFFWIYGSAFERIYGSGRLLTIYVIGAFVSIWAHVLTVSPWMADVPAIGSSGAISAVLGAFLVNLPNVRIRFLVFNPLYSRPLPTHGPAYFVLGGWFIMQILYGLKAVAIVGDVAFWAHIAGFGAGAAVASIINRLTKHLKAREAAATGIVGEEAQEVSLDSAISALVKGTPEEALSLAVGSFARARDSYDHGLSSQIYIWMLENFGDEPLPGWIHRDAAHACLRMKMPALSLHAFEMAAGSSAIDDPRKAMAGFRAALLRAGETEKAEQASAIILKFFPEMHPEASS